MYWDSFHYLSGSLVDPRFCNLLFWIFFQKLREKSNKLDREAALVPSDPLDPPLRVL